jgi:hypothetical protein
MEAKEQQGKEKISSETRNRLRKEIKAEEKRIFSSASPPHRQPISQPNTPIPLLPSPHSRNFPFHLASFRPKNHKHSPQTKRSSYSNCRKYCSLVARLVQAQPETYNWNQRFRWLLRVPGVLDSTNPASPSPQMQQVPSVLCSPKDLIGVSWGGPANYVRKLLGGFRGPRAPSRVTSVLL